MDIDAHLAQRVRNLRKRQGLALNALADLSGVSRSMISLIERAETSPTAAVLNKLADAFGVTLAALFAEDAARAAGAPSPLSRHGEQQVWQDPASGYVRRHLSPAGFASPIELVEVLFPPGETVTFENAVRTVTTHQQLWLLEGVMTVSIDEERWHLSAGDCLAMVLKRRICFHNPAGRPARYALALTTRQAGPERPNPDRKGNNHA